MIGSKEDRIISVISKEIARGRKKFIIYPFGEMGKQVKDILNNKFHLPEDLIIDNDKTKHETGIEIYSMEYLASYDLADRYILICSDRVDIFAEVRRAISGYVPQKKVIDIFEKDTLLVGEDYCSHMANISKLNGENICLLKRYDVKFFLPLCKVDYIQKYILLNDCYYEDAYLFYVTKVFKGVINMENSTVVDVGANIGNHSLYFVKECKANKVIAFEPIKETFKILKKNIEINELKGRIIPYNCGIGDKNINGFANGYNMANIGATSLREAMDGNIEIHTLDDFEIEDNIVLIKIDVEGFEGKVIKGALKTIERCHPIIMLESWENETICSIISMLSVFEYDFKQINVSNYVFF